MNEKKKPDTRVVLKPVNGGKTTTIASFWTDGDRPSGGLDRRIAKMVIYMRPDERTGEPAYKIEVSNEPGAKTHYTNLYTDAHGSGPAKRAPTTATDPDPARYADRNDDIPF